MNTDANASTLHPTPSRGAVVREQLRTVGGALRGELVAVGLLMAAATLVMLSYFLRDASRMDFILVDMTLPMVLLGLFAPFGVWKGEEPARRAYLWALPVARARHTLLKVFGGWGWLMVLVGIYLLWAVALAQLTGGGFGVGGEWQQAVTRRHLPPEERIREMAVEPWMWLVPFTSATVAYLLGSVVVVWTDRPWRWFATVAFTLFLVAEMVLGAGIRWVGTGLGSVLSGRFGLISALSGMPSLEGWAGAVLVWLGLTLAGVVAAAYRHQER